nr:hypothetical protein [uncultured Cohaesibacter sp.]
MSQTHEQRVLTIPLLVNYASERISSPQIQGHYSSDLSMWVVDVDGQETPIISWEHTVIDLATKTETQQESDDQEDNSGIAELGTKTATQIEQDDACMSAYLELTTKTAAQQEGDDTFPRVSGLFL